VSKPDDAVPVGLIGCGRWGRNVLRDLVALGCEVHVAVRSEQSAAVARDGGAASVVPDPEALPDVAGIVIATPTSTHAEMAERALACDVPVYVEKPLCMDVAVAERLLALGAGRLFVMDKWRYHPAIAELARMAREEELGPVQAIHARRVADVHRYGDDQDTVWCHAPHDLSIALELLGELPPPHAAVEEWMAGERVSLVAMLGGPPWVSIEVSCVAPAHRRELRVVFAEGAATLDGGWSEELRIVRSPHEGHDVEVRKTPGELPLLAELRAFVGHVRGGPPPRSSAEDAVGIVRRIAELGALARAPEVPAA
jgi:predicted dehydrogenase